MQREDGASDRRLITMPTEEYSARRWLWEKKKGEKKKRARGETLEEEHIFKKTKHPDTVEENGRERRVLQGRKRRQAGNVLFLLLLFVCMCVCVSVAWSPSHLSLPPPPVLPPRSLTRSLAQGLHCCSWMKLIQVFIYSSLFHRNTRQQKEEEEEKRLSSR